MFHYGLENNKVGVCLIAKSGRFCIVCFDFWQCLIPLSDVPWYIQSCEIAGIPSDDMERSIFSIQQKGKTTYLADKWHHFDQISFNLLKKLMNCTIFSMKMEISDDEILVLCFSLLCIGLLFEKIIYKNVRLAKCN